MENKSPLVSVIIPCYNHGKYIDEAVDSVLNQTFQDFEIIIVNDGSTDEYTNQLLANYIKPKTIVYNISNGGVAHARNYGINHSLGNLILALDADDKLHPDYIKLCVEQFKKQPETTLVYSKAAYFGERSGILDETPYSYKSFLLYDTIFCSAIYKKSDYLKTNGYRSEYVKGAEDWDFWLQLLNEDSIVYRIDQVLFYYRILSSSRDNSYNKADRIEFETLIYKLHSVKYTKLFGSPIEIHRQYQILCEESKRFSQIKQQIYNSLSYKIGHIILMPFKLLKQVIKK